jgi:hypothetical protein
MPGILTVLDTGIVLAVSKYRVDPLVPLSECTDNSHFWASVNYPNYYPGNFFLRSMPPEDYPKWTWNWMTRLFSPTQPHLITEEVREMSRLAVSKTDAFNRMMLNINLARDELQTGTNFQETVYLQKRMQAQAFKNAGYDENMTADIPYVVQHADLTGLSLRHAAGEILFKAKLDDECLLRTEAIRLTYFNKVKEAKKPEVLQGILDGFMDELFGNSLS